VKLVASACCQRGVRGSPVPPSPQASSGGARPLPTPALPPSGASRSRRRLPSARKEGGLSDAPTGSTNADPSPNRRGPPSEVWRGWIVSSQTTCPMSFAMSPAQSNRTTGHIRASRGECSRMADDAALRGIGRTLLLPNGEPGVRPASAAPAESEQRWQVSSTLPLRQPKEPPPSHSADSPLRTRVATCLLPTETAASSPA
jgi:hypothetical protein